MNVRYRIRNFVGAYPPLFRLYHRLFGRHKWLAFNPGTDIVIEGFPRSANTFAVIAFEISQDRTFSVAHHLHVPCQIANAVRAGIPCIVLIRDPIEAITSLVIREPEISPTEAASAYLRFYSSITDMLDDVVVGDFETVTNSYGRVIEAVNEKYGMSFHVFDHSEQNVAEVMGQIDALKEDLPNALFRTASKPSSRRSELKDEIRGSVVKSIGADRIRRMNDLYNRFRSSKTGLSADALRN